MGVQDGTVLPSWSWSSSTENFHFRGSLIKSSGSTVSFSVLALSVTGDGSSDQKELVNLYRDLEDKSFHSRYRPVIY